MPRQGAPAGDDVSRLRLGCKSVFFGQKKKTPRSNVCAKKAETGEKRLLAYKKNGVFLGLNELVFSKKKKTVACGLKTSQKSRGLVRGSGAKTYENPQFWCKVPVT